MPPTGTDCGASCVETAKPVITPAAAPAAVEVAQTAVAEVTMNVSYETLATLAVRTPTAGDRIYKDECAYSFTSPESEDGLYVSLFSFLGFSKQHALEYAAKTRHKVVANEVSCLMGRS